MLKVATFTKPLICPCTSEWASQKEQPSSLFRLPLFYLWEQMENPGLKPIA